MAERLRTKLLPGSPETIDASELFMLALPSAFDAQWLAALDEAQLNRLVELLASPGGNNSPGGATRWHRALLDAITYCAGQILSTGFAPELRLRMSESAREAQPFHALIRDVESLRVEVLHALRTPDRLNESAQRLRERLEACRAAAATVYTHFEDNGISVGLVFRLRQLRERILRVRELLDCLLSAQPAVTAAQLMAHLVMVGQERRSLRALLASNSSLLAAKVAERSAETGEYYITRTGTEYRAMLRKAAGGGALMAVTTLTQFGLHALAVFPAVLALATLIALATGGPAISVNEAEHVLASLHLLGPSLFFAAFTGVLLFASSIIAGWTENWFVLHRMDSALHYNPRITALLGVERAARWARFLRENLSGLAANVSLGFMLGLVPAFAAFFGLGLDVRHVTLSTGQVAAASAALGLQVLHLPAFWWAVASLPFLGALNVSVSFYLAFSLALRAQNVSGVDRSRIYAAIRVRLRSAPE